MKTFYPLIVVAILSSHCDMGDRKLVAVGVSAFVNPSKDSASEPYLFTANNGTVFFSWIKKNNDEASLQFASLNNNKWSEPRAIATGKNWFLNWADYPVIAAADNGRLLAHFLQKSDSGKYTYNVMVTHSRDNGLNWSVPFVLHDDATLSEHGFVSIVPYKDNFVLSWLDGRQTVQTDHNAHNDHHGQMTLRAAVINADGVKISDELVDDRVCDCCQTRLAATAGGPVLVYRDRSATEVRDISIARYINGGWTAPKTIFADNWVIEGCPVNGPAIDAIGNTVGVGWFNMSDNKGRVNFMFSNDAGNSFGDTIRIDEGKPVGRVDVILIDPSTAMVCWMESNSIRAVKVHSDGSRERSVPITSTTGARSAGFPQMTRVGDRLLFAWTDDSDKTIRMATLPLL